MAASSSHLRSRLLAALALALLCGSLTLPASARGSRKIHLQKPTAKVNPDPEHDHITFDPLVAEVERHAEDKEWESQYEKSHHQRHHVEAGHHHEHENEDDLTIDEYHDEDAEHEEFLHDAGVEDPDTLDESSLDDVDMEKRLDVLFPLIDLAPMDGMVDINELASWELRQYQEQQDHRMERELEAMDADGDGRVSLKEYLHDDSEGDNVKHWSEYAAHDQDYYRLEQERFHVADDDGDNFLDKRQLHKVLHPEESNDPRVKAHLRQEEIRNYDENKNEKIELGEWEDGFWHIIHEWDEEERKWDARAHGRGYTVGGSGEDRKRRAKLRFQALDRDGDGALTADEIEPIMFIMQPGEGHFAMQTARHLMEQADDDKDNKLTMKEMKKHKQIFYEIDQGHKVDED